MIFTINTFILAGLASSSIGLASYKLYYYAENRKIEAEYDKLLESYLNNDSNFIIDYSDKIYTDYEPYRVIHFESVYDFQVI